MRLCQLNITSMLTVAISADTVRRCVENDDRLQELAISCNNSSFDCVVDERISQLKDLKEQLSVNVKVKSKMLDVSLTYHIEAMDPILQKLKTFAQAIEIKKSEISIVSNVFDRVIQAEKSAFTEDYFALHCRQMIAFDEKIQNLLQNDIDAIFEDHLKSAQIDLLEMSFFEKKFRAEYREVQKESTGQEVETVFEANISSHTFFSKIAQHFFTNNNHTSIYETKIDVLKNYIKNHVVCGYALCPASMYHEMILFVVKDHRVKNANDLIWSLSQVHYVSSLLYLEDCFDTMMRTIVNATDDTESAHYFIISSCVQGQDANQSNVHCERLIKTKPRTLTEQKYSRLAIALKHKKSSYSSQTSSQKVFFTKAMYEKIFTRIVTYSALYQVVQSIRINRDINEVFALCRLQNFENTDNSDKAIIVMNVLLHIADFVANYDLNNESACICKKVKSIVLTQKLASSAQTFEIHCSVLALPSERSILANAYAIDSKGIFAIFKSMLFQKVKQAKLNQAFRITIKNSAQSETVSEKATAAQPVSSTSEQMTSQSSSSKTRVNIKSIIASICEINQTSLSDDIRLSALDFDSLMLAELEFNIVSKADSQSNISSLAQCESVREIERLFHIEEQIFNNEDSEHITDDSVSSQTPNKESSVASIIVDTCGADLSSVSPDVKFQTLGIDSLMNSELHFRLEEMLESKKVFFAKLSKCQTVADVTKMVEKLRSDKALSSSSLSFANSAESLEDLTSGSMVTPSIETGSSSGSQISLFTFEKVLCLQTQSERIQFGDDDQASKAYSLFLVHDGSGVCLFYRRLAPLHRLVFGIHDFKLLISESWFDIPAMATEYVDLIRRTTHDKPSILSGWSFGGVVAFEAARILLQSGHPIAGVILIDSPPPLHHQPLSQAVIAEVTSRDGGNGLRTAVQDLTRRSFTSSAAMLAAFRPNDDKPAPRIFLLRSREGFQLQKKKGSEEAENPWLQDREDPRTGVEG
ncbi:MAG: hypothetical protein Q9195_004838 [Heterodermia aff. obscurata]